MAPSYLAAKVECVFVLCVYEQSGDTTLIGCRPMIIVEKLENDTFF